MSSILAKQVKGAVDDSSPQEIGGEKTFLSRVHFPGDSMRWHIAIEDGFIYWLADKDKTGETGNKRQGIINGELCIQTFNGEQWVTTDR